MLDYKSWDHVVNLVGSRLAQWMSCHLSMGGRITLIKSVLNYIPIYALSVYVLYVRVRNNLYSLMSMCLWGGFDNFRKLHLVDWNTITMPIDSGWVWAFPSWRI